MGRKESSSRENLGGKGLIIYDLRKPHFFKSRNFPDKSNKIYMPLENKNHLFSREVRGFRRTGLYAPNAGDYAHAGQDIQRTNVEEMPRAICKLNNKVCYVLTMNITH